MFKTLKNLIIPEKVAFVEKREEAQNAWTFAFEQPKRRYQAGQHFLVILKHEDPDNRRSLRIFSASSAPHEKYLTITTRYFGEESSSFKQAMFAMQPGETVNILGPSPVSDVNKIKDYSKPYVFIAGGVGITPYRAVLKEAVDHSKPLQGTLFYCNKNNDFIFGSEIKELVGKLDNFELVKVLSPERVTPEQVESVLEKYEQTPIFKIAGTPDYVKHYAEMLHNDAGVVKKYINRIHTEEYWGDTIKFRNTNFKYQNLNSRG